MLDVDEKLEVGLNLIYKESQEKLRMPEPEIASYFHISFIGARS